MFSEHATRCGGGEFSLLDQPFAEMTRHLENGSGLYKSLLIHLRYKHKVFFLLAGKQESRALGKIGREEYQVLEFQEPYNSPLPPATWSMPETVICSYQGLAVALLMLERRLSVAVWAFSN